MNSRNYKNDLTTGRYIFRCLPVIIALIFVMGLGTGCSVEKLKDVISGDENKAEDNVSDSGKSNDNKAPSPTPEVITYHDAEGNEFVMAVDPEVKRHKYDLSKLKHKKGSAKISYDDGTYTIRKGVDVSHHNGVIDWEKVKKAGYEFAFLRLGYRGYGKEGKVLVDREFQSSFKRARAAGLDLGVYFFSQAINEEEAIEEAELVLRELNNSKLELPVVYDPELIKDDEARTDNVDGDQFTKNTIAFCKRIKKAGYKPAIYSNMYWEDQLFDLKKLSDYPIWFADYSAKPQTPYHFRFWQFSESGKVDGIGGSADLNVEFIKKQ